jgi:hypothetical protein
VPADGYSVKACLSDDGRFVAFESYATNLVPLDSNFWGDCFLRDRLLGTTERVSVSSSGVQAHLGAKKPSMSVDGRFIAFESQSSNLVLGDFDGVDDVFVRDRATGVTELVSKTTAGVAVGGDAPSISADGRFVSFVSSSPQLIPHDLNNHADVFVVDRLTGAAHVAGRDAGGDLGDGDARQPALSGDGRWVAFGSLATNFAPNDNNNLLDYFVHDVAPTVPIAYCTAKPNSAGCTPSIAASGIASVSLAPPQFWVHGQNVLNQKVGYLFYGLGIGNWPYMGGTLCVSVPVRRTPGVNSGGNAAPPTDCSGLLSFDFNSWIRSGVDPTLVPGTVVDVQWAYRDPADPHKIGFTDALQFVISD